MTLANEELDLDRLRNSDEADNISLVLFLDVSTCSSNGMPACINFVHPWPEDCVVPVARLANSSSSAEFHLHEISALCRQQLH